MTTENKMRCINAVCPFLDLIRCNDPKIHKHCVCEVTGLKVNAATNYCMDNNYGWDKCPTFGRR